MKNFTFTLLFLSALFLSANLFAQCPTGDVTLTTQAEVDQFVADYPNCEILKNVEIFGGDITNLSTAFSNIIEIKGNLAIYSTSAPVINFNKLKKLTSEGILRIQTGNTTQINFPLLERVRLLFIRYNQNLELNLPKFLSATEQVRITDNGNISLNMPMFKSARKILDISRNTGLLSLDLNGLTGIEYDDYNFIKINNNANLKTININKLGHIGELYIKDNPELTTIHFDDLSSVGSPYSIGFSISNNAKLTSVNFDKLTDVGYSMRNDPSLQIIKNPALEQLNFAALKRANISISNNSSLTNLGTFQNLIRVYKLTITDNLNLTDCSGLCNILNNNEVTGSFTIENNPSACSSQSEVVAVCNPNSPKTHVPDNNFEQALIDLGYDDVLNNYVTTSNINTLTSLDIHGRNIADLTGITDFIALKTLHCYENNLINIDISKNIALEDFSCRNNNLMSLNISKNIALIDLSCRNNKLTSLDISNNVALKYLYTANNQITSLDLSTNTALARLYCEDNQLSSLLVKNGNNSGIESANFVTTNNPNLNCIEVDNASYSTANWTSIDSHTHFSEDCSAVSNPCPTGDITLSTQAEVDQFVANYPNCEVIEGTLTISGNDISDISGLSNITEIKGKIFIGSTPNLTNINLKNLTTAGLGFILSGTGATSASFENLKTVNGNGGPFYVSGNSVLQNLNLPKLESTAGHLIISINPNLSSLDLGQLISSFRIYIEDTKLTSLNLGKLKSVGEGSFFLKNNTKLLQFDLSSLTAVSYISIIENSQLEQISTLENLTTVTGNLTITNNPNLTDCSGLCNVLNNNGVTGTITIENNPSACSSQSEVEASCASLAVTDELDSNFTVYPNPTQGILTLSADLADAKYTITDIMGRILKKDILKTNTIDITTFKSGVYYLSIVKGNDTLVKTVIKN